MSASDAGTQATFTRSTGTPAAGAPAARGLLAGVTGVESTRSVLIAR